MEDREKQQERKVQEALGLQGRGSRSLEPWNTAKLNIHGKLNQISKEQATDIWAGQPMLTWNQFNYIYTNMMEQYNHSIRLSQLPSSQSII